MGLFGMDTEIRLAVFNWLAKQTDMFGETLDRKMLEKGAPFQGGLVTLLGAQGIWKPKQCEYPISITSIPEGPYNDSLKNDVLHYSYRGKDPNHPSNVLLREMMVKQIPLIYFLGIIRGRYMASWPAYITYDQPHLLQFQVEFDDRNHLYLGGEAAEKSAETLRRKYITANVLIRQHQQKFSERVIHAYQEQCALCHLRHRELLDAAHIIGDKEEGGEPVISNGLALCKIHHAAFDRFIIGITPDYIIKVRQEVLDEIDGPMLKYGIQSLQNSKLILPKSKNDFPDREKLAQRYLKFLSQVA